MKVVGKTITFAVAVGLLTFAGVSHARDWATIQKSGTIVVATEGDYPPFTFFNGTQLTGFEVELAEAVVKEMGLKMEWRVVPFDAQISALRQDRFDFAISSHGFTDERFKAVDYGNFHYCSGGRIASWVDGPLKVDQIPGKTVSAQISTTYAENTQKIPGIGQVKIFGTDAAAFQALKSHKVDAWISDNFTVKATLAAANEPKIVAGDYLFHERIGAIFRKGNAEVRQRYNDALAAVVKNGTYARLSNDFLKEDASCK